MFQQQQILEQLQQQKKAQQQKRHHQQQQQQNQPKQSNSSQMHQSKQFIQQHHQVKQQTTQKQIAQQQQQQLQQQKQNTSSPSNNPGYKRPRQIFSIEQEEELAEFVRDTSQYYNGMSSKDVRILAFVYGICNQVEIPIGWRDTHQASFDWCLGFIKRNKLTPMMINNHKTSTPLPVLAGLNGGGNIDENVATSANIINNNKNNNTSLKNQTVATM